MNGAFKLGSAFNTAFVLLALLAPRSVKAQFNYSTNKGVVTITGYTGTNGFVTIPSTIVGLPVTSIADYAFYQKLIVTNVTVPDSVTNIGYVAFYNCSRMTNITFGTNLLTIGSSAFQFCSGLTYVGIPNTVTNMGNSVFASCSALISINLGSNLTAIGTSAFADSSSLTNITIPNGVKSIGSQAFYRCFSLQSAVVSDAVTNIGLRAFWSCVNLRSLALGANVSTIGSYAFQSCSNLANVGLPDSITTLGDYAFSLCPKLAQIAIGTNLASVGNYAFQGCLSLAQITIPASVTNIGAFAFANCYNLTAISVAPNNPAYVSVAGALLNLSQTTLIQYPAGNTAQTYTIPNTVTYIADGAFQDCSALVSISIPASVTRIPNNVFRGCASLTSVTIPNSIRYIPSGAFYGCGNLVGIIIPNTLTNIGDGAFQGCTSLVSVSIPDGVSNIANNAFRGCSALTSVTIPDRVPQVGNSTFLGCTSLTNATIGNKVTNIQASAFFGCSNLTSVRMGYVITTVGTDAFRNCSSLAAIYFYGDAPQFVSTSAFTNDPATAYYLPGAVGWGTIPVGLPAALWIPFTYATNSGGLIITECTDPFLSAITVSNTLAGLPVVGIGDQAFGQCAKLVSITVADTVTNIGGNAFAGSTNLIDIYFHGNAPAVASPVFAAAPNATVYYRPGTTGWNSTFDGLPTALWIQFNRNVNNGTVEIETYTDSINDVIIPPTINGLPVTAIGLQAFRFSSITSVSMPDTITYVASGGAFDSCGALHSVKLSRGLTYIAWWMFANCTSLTNITIPASVNTIVNFGFYNCGLRSIYFEGNAPGFQSGGYSASYAFAFCPVTAYYLPGTTGWPAFLSLFTMPGQLWDPQIQTSDGSFGVRSNQFGFNITGTSNLVVVVQTCADPSNPVWTPLQTSTLSGSPLYFSDSQWTNYPSRFYRLHWP